MLAKCFACFDLVLVPSSHYTGTTYETEKAYLSVASDFTLSFWWVCVAQSIVLRRVCIAQSIVFGEVCVAQSIVLGRVCVAQSIVLRYQKTSKIC